MSEPNPFELINLNDPEDLVILNYVNKHNDDLWEEPLTMSNAIVGAVTDLTITDENASPDSQIKIISMPNRGYKGAIDVKYNRINLGEFIEGWIQGHDYFSKLPTNTTIEEIVDLYNEEFVMGLNKKNITNLIDKVDLAGDKTFSIKVGPKSKLFNGDAVIPITYKGLVSGDGVESRRLTAQSTAVEGSDHLNYPAYIDLSQLDNDFWITVKEDGSDIRVVDNDYSQLPIDVFYFDKENKKGGVFAKVDSLSTDSKIIISVDGQRSKYDRTDDYGSDNVWDTDIYDFVSNDGGFTDSTKYARESTIHGDIDDGYNNLGRISVFDGTKKYISFPGDEHTNKGGNPDKTFTVISIAKTVNNKQLPLLSTAGGNIDQQQAKFLYSHPYILSLYYQNKGNKHKKLSFDYPVSFDYDEFHFMVSTHHGDGDWDTDYIILDNEKITDYTLASEGSFDHLGGYTRPLFIGASLPDHSQYHSYGTGEISMLRLMSIIPSDDRVKTETNNIMHPETFWTIENVTGNL